MISTTRDKDKKQLLFADDARQLGGGGVQVGGVTIAGAEIEGILPAVQSAMRLGLTEFTTPTTEDNDHQLNWKVRRFVHMRGDKLVCNLVAQIVEHEHFQVIGAEVDLPGQDPKK